MLLSQKAQAIEEGLCKLLRSSVSVFLFHFWFLVSAFALQCIDVNVFV